MKFIAKLFGEMFFMAWLVASSALFFYYRDGLANWLGGFLGTVVALFAAPGVFVFPLIYWFVQGAFPTSYFELLGVCVASAFFGGLYGGSQFAGECPN
jgi:hypothetical protein